MTHPTPMPPSYRIMMLRSFVIPLVVLLTVMMGSPSFAQPVGGAPVEDSIAEAPRNLILFIADGFGPAAATMGREAKGAPLAMDSILAGSVETSATDSRVTDSAASATAFACGLKTYNGAIAVDTLRRPCRTVLEAAETRGMATGLVATSRVTHATPAAFAAHVPDRGMEDEIADQMSGSGVEVLFGGGRRHFTADGRADGRDVLAEMADNGASVATSRDGFDALTETPGVALLAASHLDYEIDREDGEQPSLAEMTGKAITLLNQSEEAREKGFFLMVEASRIDHAEHGNDAAAALGDVLAYDAAVDTALSFARDNGETLVVATADHETGGLSLGQGGVYAWDPAVLQAVPHSMGVLAEEVQAALERGASLDEMMALAGLDSLTNDEREEVESELEEVEEGDRLAELVDEIGDLISERAGIGWTTGGHTAVDVGLYATGPGAGWFAGALSNDEVGRRLLLVLRAAETAP